MAKRIQTTYTFTTLAGADLFMKWLAANEQDDDYGYPKYINLRAVHGWCVEYSYEGNFARGVATGIELATMND